MKRTDENHSFSIHVATILKGHVQKAILLKEIYGWVNINASKKINIKHGIVWTYMSSSGFAKKFPYMGGPSIRRWMLSLEKNGWLYSGKFNKKAYDKTKWYTINVNKYDDAVLSKKHTVDQNNQWVDQIDQWIVQNDQSIVQIDQWIAQNNQPIPSPTQLLPNNTNSLLENKKIKDLERANNDLQKELAEIKKLLEKPPTKKPKQKRKIFIAPPLEILIPHFIEKGSTENEARKFYNHYESNGWKVGKTKMVSWKHSVSGWIGRNTPEGITDKPKEITQQQAKARILEIWKNHKKEWGGELSKYGMQAKTNYITALKLFYKDYPELKPQANEA